MLNKFSTAVVAAAKMETEIYICNALGNFSTSFLRNKIMIICLILIKYIDISQTILNISKQSR